MTARKGRQWTWRDNVYGVRYELVVAPWDEFSRTFDEPLADREPTAFTVIHEPGSIQSIAFWFPPRIRPRTARWASAVAHEALHATLGVLSDRGIQNMTEETEAATYYLGWLVEEMLVRLGEKRG